MASHTSPAGRRIAFTLPFALLLGIQAPASAQETGAAPEGGYLESLKACQQLADDTQRLACFDEAVGTIVAASDAGDVRVVDREQRRETRRSLFGFNLPDLGIFGGGDEDEENELFETTIDSVRYLTSRKVRFTTAEGAVWEMNNVPRRMRTIEAGNRVVFKEASLGYYFVRIAGQTGIKGRRVQ